MIFLPQICRGHTVKFRCLSLSVLIICTLLKNLACFFSFCYLLYRKLGRQRMMTLKLFYMLSTSSVFQNFCIIQIGENLWLQQQKIQTYMEMPRTKLLCLETGKLYWAKHEESFRLMNMIHICIQNKSKMKL